jgi:putative transposase
MADLLGRAERSSPEAAYQLRRYDEAVGFARDAARHSTADLIWPFVHLAAALGQLGRTTEALEQMVAIIREGDREPVSAFAKRHGISEQSIYTWRKRFGGFQADDVRRLKQLEAENARLKKLVAERDLEIEVMKEVAAKNW